jgi:diadenosine tetraphosphatase ApaH/serine/threonine PP2A family protein phosphatase
VINRGPRPVECADFVLARNWTWVRGNHEEYVLSHVPVEGVAKPASPFGTSHWTYQRLNGQIAWVQQLPFQWSERLPDGSEVRVVHGSMRHLRDCIFPDTPDETLREQIAPAPRLFVVGHTHIPVVRTVDETLVVNVGSAGLPFDGDPRVSYARLTWQSGCWDAEIVRLDYDRAQADRDFDETGFSDQIGPLALLIRAELHQACSQLGEWARDYQAAVATGELTLAESVGRLLAA